MTHRFAKRIGRLAVLLGGLGVSAGAAAACAGYSTCPRVNYVAVAGSAAAQAMTARLDATRDAATRAASQVNIPFGNRTALLGQAIVFDRGLSVNGRQACASCHLPEAGFGGGLAAYAPAAGVVPGAVLPRAAARAPQSLAYAAFAPLLGYDSARDTFVGGAFRDLRATGALTGNPAGDQAMVPFTGPLEMALPDPACAVWRLSRAPYAAVFSLVWGAESFAIAWPGDTARVCATPAGGTVTPRLALGAGDRARATTAMNFLAQTILAFEASSLASPFSSKYDAFVAGQASLTPAEQTGLFLFSNRGRCAACHAVTGERPLFTDFSAANLGVPANPALPFLTENVADARGLVANPAGRAYRDPGLGAVLAKSPRAAWRALAPRFKGAFQTPTLRNVAAGAGAGGRRYMHNGVFGTLKMVVHFYNTRDTLPRCAGTAGMGVSCWPAPEVAANVTGGNVGKLGLSAAEEDAIVAFLGALTDGYVP